MEMKQITAIAVVAVVVAAGAGIGWLLLSNDDSGDGISVNAALEVYGNADGDGKIDEGDITVIQSIIDGAASFGDHPLADANCDGVIDMMDIEQVRDIINATAGNPVAIYHLNHTTASTGNYIAKTLYPITSAVATGASNSLLNFKYLGIADELHGLSFGTTVPDTNLFFEFAGLLRGTNLGIADSTSAQNMNKEGVVQLKSLYDVSAIITSDNQAYVSNENEFENDLGIDVVRVKASAADLDEYASSLVMLAFLFDTDGKGYMERCADLVDWLYDFYGDLEEMLGGVGKKVSAVASSSNNRVGSGTSEYTAVLTSAGAGFPLTEYQNHSSTVVTYNQGNGDTWLTNYQIDYVINIRTSPTGTSWYGGTVLSGATTGLTTMMTQFNLLECYEEGNVFVISGDMPVFIRIAYCAEIFYQNIFGQGYADAVHLDFAQRFMGFSESDMEGKRFVVSMTDLGLRSV